MDFTRSIPSPPDTFGWRFTYLGEPPPLRQKSPILTRFLAKNTLNFTFKGLFFAKCENMFALCSRTGASWGMIFRKYHPPYLLTSPLKDRPQLTQIQRDLGSRVLRCAFCTPQIPIYNQISGPLQAEMDHVPPQTGGVWGWNPFERQKTPFEGSK